MTIEKHERSTKDLVKAAVSGWLGTDYAQNIFDDGTVRVE